MDSVGQLTSIERTKRVLVPLAGRLQQIESLYSDFHRNPELSGQEERTAARVGELLGAYGFDVTAGLGGHGVAAILRNGEGPVVMMRAELDGLPVRELTDLPYASTATARNDEGDAVPVAHACGHDAHLACLLGTSELLSEARDAWRGSLLVVAQPAEETGTGAIAILADGLYSRVAKPDVALAQHVVPMPAGLIAHREGPLMAASAILNVKIFGTGGHGAVPHATVDPVVIAGHVITRVQSIVAREVDPAGFAVISVGMVRAGTAANVIPSDAELGISVRTYDEEVQAHVIAAVERVVRAEAAASGAPREPKITVTQTVPVNSNTPSHTRIVRAAHEAYFSRACVIDAPPVPASEDFPYFGTAGPDADGTAVPTVYWLLGSMSAQVWDSSPGDTLEAKLANIPVNHSPFFAPAPQPTLRTGVEAMGVAALAFLPAP